LAFTDIDEKHAHFDFDSGFVVDVTPRFVTIDNYTPRKHRVTEIARLGEAILETAFPLAAVEFVDRRVDIFVANDDSHRASAAIRKLALPDQKMKQVFVGKAVHASAITLHEAVEGTRGRYYHLAFRGSSPLADEASAGDGLFVTAYETRELNRSEALRMLRPRSLALFIRECEGFVEELIRWSAHQTP
jgi:hypothetical protein